MAGRADLAAVVSSRLDSIAAATASIEVEEGGLELQRVEDVGGWIEVMLVKTLPDWQLSRRV